MLGLSIAEIRCLLRTKIAQDFGKRIITHRDNALFVEGRVTEPKTWFKLHRMKLVANTRSGSCVKLTEEGERKLRDVLRALRKRRS